MSRTRDIAAILGATEASNTSNVALLNNNSSVGLDSSQVSTIAGAEGVATYDSTGALPVSHNVGDQAFVTGVSRLYFSNGSGWYSQNIINANPRWADSVGSGIGEPNGTLTITDSATPLIVKAVEGACITPDNEHITLFSEPGATAALSITFVNANVVVEPSGVIVLHLM